MRLEKDCPAPVCGLDEAGRGPWAGPVSAGAVILKPGSEDNAKRIFEKWELDFAVIGRVTETGRLVLKMDDEKGRLTAEHQADAFLHLLVGDECGRSAEVTTLADPSWVEH